MTFRSTLSALSALAVASACLSPLFASGQEVTLRAVNAFQKGTAFAKAFENFTEIVNREGKGLIKINYIGGPEVMPPFEVGNAVKNGTVDIASTTGAFYTNLLPAADALKLSELTIQEQRKNGAWAYINKLHNEKLNVYYLAGVNDGGSYHLYLNKPIGKPDLAGYTIRVSPVYRAFFTALGANLVQTAPGEVYTALERGVIDGYGWPILGIFDLGWQEKTKYRVDPGFYAVYSSFLVNLDTWDKKLNDKQRTLLQRIATEIEATNSVNAKLEAEAKKQQAQAGIKTITFEGQERKVWLDTAHQAGWAYIEKVAPQQYPELHKLLTK